MHPTMARSQSIKFWKKCLSRFMPNKHTPWNVESNTGNPTHSVQMNDMTKDVVLAETRQQGALSHARRSTTAREFRSLQAPHVFGFSADIRCPQGEFKHETNLQNCARDNMFKRPEFRHDPNDPNNGNLLGSHSVRKHASSV